MLPTAVRDRTTRRSDWQDPVFWWLAVAAFNCVTALLRGVTTTGEAARWWALIDAQIPERTARWFLDGANGLLLPGLHASDRGPLQPLLLLWGGRWSTNPVPAYFSGVVLNSVWVMGLWWFLRAVDVEETRIRWTVLLTAITGPIWLNTVYPWPKLLAGACMLGCAWAILSRRPLLAGLFGGLALLAHGGALFALAGLVPWAITRLGRKALPALLVLGAVYAPWHVFAKVVDPPGDVLVKFHLAGITEPDDRSLVDAIAGEYKEAGSDVLAYKVNNMRVVLGDPTIKGDPTGPWTPAWHHDALGIARSYQSTRIILAPGVLLLGLFFGWRRVPRTVWMMLSAWLAAYVLLEWGGHGPASAWLHTAPMSLVIGWVAVCALASPRWMFWPAGATFVGMWFLAPSAF